MQLDGSGLLPLPLQGPRCPQGPFLMCVASPSSPAMKALLRRWAGGCVGGCPPSAFARTQQQWVRQRWGQGESRIPPCGSRGLGAQSGPGAKQCKAKKRWQRGPGRNRIDPAASASPAAAAPLRRAVGGGEAASHNKCTKLLEYYYAHPQFPERFSTAHTRAQGTRYPYPYHIQGSNDIVLFFPRVGRSKKPLPTLSSRDSSLE